MDKEEFNSTEINKIKEFIPFEAELFNVPEELRSRMEQYRPREMANSSLPETPFEEETQGLSQQMKDELKNSLNSAGQSSGPTLQTSGMSGGGGLGASTAATTATTASSVGATATSIVTTATSVGTLAVAAVVGGVATGVIPTQEDYGTLNQTNYEVLRLRDEETHTEYGLLRFNFNGEIKKGFKGVLVDITNPDEPIKYEIIPENPVVEVKSELDSEGNTISNKFRFEIHNKSNEVLYTKDIIIDPIDIDFSRIELAERFRTTYVEETNSANIYFYIKNNLKDLASESDETYYFDKVDAYGVSSKLIGTPEYEETVYEANKIAEINGDFVYEIKNFNLEQDLIKAFPYIKSKENYYRLPHDIRIPFMTNNNIDYRVTSSLFELSLGDDEPQNDINVKVIHDSGDEEAFVIPKNELQPGMTYKKLLSQESDNPNVTVTYIGITPGIHDDPIITDELISGSKYMQKKREETAYVKHIGDISYKNYQIEQHYIESDPEDYEKITFNFLGFTNSDFNCVVVNNKTQETQTIDENSNSASFIYKLAEKDNNLDYTFNVIRKSDNVVVKTTPITVEKLSLDQGYALTCYYETAYEPGIGRSNVYYYLDADFLKNYPEYPFTKFDIFAQDAKTKEELKLYPEPVEGYENMYVFKGVQSRNFNVTIQPYFEVNGNLYQFEHFDTMEIRIDNQLNHGVVGQKYTFGIFYEDPLSDVHVDITHENGLVENLVIPKEELTNQKQTERFLQNFSVNPKIDVRYDGIMPSFDPQDYIPDTVLVGNKRVTKYTTETLDNDPSLTYGSIAYDHADVSYLSDGSKKDIVFHFVNTINQHYYLSVLDPTTNTPVKSTTVNQLSLTGVQGDLYDFTIYIYCTNFNSYDGDDSKVREIKVNVPDEFVPGTM